MIFRDPLTLKTNGFVQRDISSEEPGFPPLLCPFMTSSIERQSHLPHAMKFPFLASWRPGSLIVAGGEVVPKHLVSNSGVAALRQNFALQGHFWMTQYEIEDKWLAGWLAGSLNPQ